MGSRAPAGSLLMGLALTGAGLSIAADVSVRLSATLLGVLLLLSVLFFHVARVAGNPLDLGLRTRAFEALAGAGFIAAGVCIATRWMARWGATLLGTMFGLWFLLLHAPRILGFSKVAGAPSNPNEWCSAFIALAMCGGSWIVAEAAPGQKSQGRAE